MKNLLLFAAMLLAMATKAQQVEKNLTASNGVYIGFQEYKPADYNSNPNTKYPLIIFLHGIGERGDGKGQLANVASTGIPRYIKDGDKMTFTWNGKTETFLVLSPQLSNNYGWWQPFYVEEMLKYAKQNLRIDTNRVILTGLSLGGGGVWGYAAGNATNAKNLAAIAPVCGTCQNVSWANIVNANLPVWGFHAQDDGTVPASCTNGAVTAINNLNGNVKAYMTIWPTGQHWIWDRAYDRTLNQQNPNVFEWFMAQNKSLAPNKRPVANAGNDMSTTTGSGSVVLNASASTDADGSIVRYVWRLVSGPTQASFPAAYATTATTTVSGLSIAGTYQFELKAVDNRADWSTDMVTVTVTSGGASNPPSNPTPPPAGTNKPAVAKAGVDITVTLPATVTLDGAGSSDPDGAIKQYEWAKISGGAATITDSKAAKTTVTGLVAGSYSFKLTVWGDNWAPVSDTVKVTVNAAPVVVVPNKVPVAMAGQDQTVNLPMNIAALNGAASYDADGNIAKYEWTKISGPAVGSLADANKPTCTAVNLVQGTYSYRLQVTDDKAAVSADTVSVTIKTVPVTGNQAVVANAGADQTITLPVTKAILDGSSSNDPDGEPKVYEWKRISGPSTCAMADPKSSVAIAAGLVAGTYTFQLMVWGDNWVPRADTMVIVVKAPVTVGNVAPIVNAGAACTVTLPLNSVTLNGSASYDMDGTIVSYQWSKISGPASYDLANDTAVSTALNNLVAGTYQFRLQATDNSSASNDDTVTVQVVAAPNSPVVAIAGDDINIALPVNSVDVDATASYDVDGAVKAYEWKKISGPAAYSIDKSKSAKATISNLEAGTYQFELMVWGDNWVPRADTLQVTVAAAEVGSTVRMSSARTAEIIAEPSVKVFPSPATENITLQYQDDFKGQATAVIYDISGKIVSSIIFNKESAVYQRSINISKLQKGVYHLAVISKGKRMLVNFVKQ